MKLPFFTFSLWLLIALLFSECNQSLKKENTQNAGKPNVILIMADDMGYECLEVNGGLSYETPNLNRLAEQGMRFNHCYSQPLCTPSRVKIMTGKYNYRNYEDFGYLNPEEKTFGNFMKKSGYATCIVGKWQLNGRKSHPGWQDKDRPHTFGFEEYCLWQLTETKSRYANPFIEQNGKVLEGLENAYGPDVFCSYALDFIERKQDQPFFLYYPMVLPHFPFVPTPDSEEWKDKDKRQRANKRFFKDMVEYVDKIVGSIRQKIEELGIQENTLIIFTGDNGTHRPIVTQTRTGPYRGGKGKTINAGTHVPLIAYWPGYIKSASVYDGLINFNDFYPTLAEIAGVEVPSDGKSFLALLEEKPYKERETILVHYDPKIRPQINKWRARFARTKNYKLYQDGRFYHIPTDKLEQDTISLEHVSWEVIKTHTLLQEKLDQAPEWKENE